MPAYNPYVYNPVQMPDYTQYQYAPIIPQSRVLQPQVNQMPQQVNPMQNQIQNQLQPQMQTQQIQDGGFIRVKNIDEARNYPVAPGNSITFKIEGAPYLCTKTMGFSQLEQPRFEKFKLVKEDDSIAQTDENAKDNSMNDKPYATEDELKETKEAIEKLKSDFEEEVKKLKERVQDIDKRVSEARMRPKTKKDGDDA